MMDTAELEDSSDSDAESVCSTVSASSSVVSSCEKTKVRAKFPPFVTTKQLYVHFGRYGFDETEVHIHRHTDRATKKPIGSATISISTSQAEEFISLLNDSLVLEKHKMKVELYRQRKQKQKKKHMPKQKQMQRQLQNASQPLLSVSPGMASPHSTSSSTETCRVFVGSGLPTYVNEQHIREHFNELSHAITRVDTIKDKQTKKPKGYFFVTFQSQAFADMAVHRFNHSLLLGEHKVKVEKQKTAQPRLPTSVQPPVVLQSQSGDTGMVSQASMHTLVVDNLDPAISNDEIEMLIGVRPIEPIKVEPGSLRRYLQFQNDRDASTAKQNLNGKILLGKVVQVVMQQDPLLSYGHHQQSNLQQPALPLAHSPLQHPLSPPQVYHSQGPQIAMPLPPHHHKAQHYHSGGQPPLFGTLPQSQPQHPLSALQGPPQPPYHQPYHQPYPGTFQPHKVPPMPPFRSENSVESGQCAAPTQLSHVSDRTGFIKVCKLPPDVTEGELEERFKHFGRITSIRIIQKDRYAYINYPSLLEAQAASVALHHMNIRGHVVDVIAKKGTSKSEKQHQQSKERESAEDVKLLKLEPEQWNQLMTVQSTGTSLYQEVVSPFQTNPNVVIEIQADVCTVKISGVPEAVSSAYEHLQRHMSKDLHVTDRTKMEALVKLFPSLPEEILAKHGATMSGFDVESSVIHFDGPTTAKTGARTEVDNLLSSAMVICVDVNFAATLIPSLRKRFQMDGILTYIKARGTVGLSNQVILCSFDRSKHEQAVKLVHSQPFEKKVDASQQDVQKLFSDQYIKGLEEEMLVSIQREDECSKLVIHGFYRSDVQAAQKKLIHSVKELSEKGNTHKFTPEEVMYLNFQYQNYPDLFIDIPVQFKKGKPVEISGSPEAIDKIVNGSLLSGLQWKRYSFKCNLRFLQQITDSVLGPLKNLDFLYLTDKPPDSRRGHMQGKQNPAVRGAENKQFDIILYSKDPTSFLQVCASLDDIKPMSRCYNFRYRESAQCVKSIKSKLESAYLVSIVEGERRAYINGLNEDDVQKCWDEIDEEIRCTVVITKTLSTTAHESKYLKRKYYEELKLEYECDIFFIKDRGELRAKGKLKDVEALESRTAEILGAGVLVEKFSITCNARHFFMWKKWWMEFKKQKEESEVIIDFFRKDRRYSSSSESEQNAEIEFEVIGTDSDQLLEIKDALCNQEIDERRVKVSAAGATALLTAKTQGQLSFIDKIAVMVHIDKKANVAVLSSPQGLVDDLDVAEQEIQKFVGIHASVHKDLTSNEPVVGLILSSKTKSATYLATANAVAKEHGVSVHPLRAPLVGLRLTGSPAAIEKVQTFIHVHVLKQIEANVKHVQLTVTHKQSGLLASPEFSRFESKLKEEYSVICSYPKVGKQSKAVHSALIQPSSSAHPIQLDICRGSIVHEKVDAIVNAANEDLKHVGGLAKDILDAGGLTIQTQSSKHVQLNGKMAPGTCVALDSGELPCKRVIHAVGPRWVDGTKGEEQTLYFTVYSCLQCADKERVDSIAFPAIGTGIFKVPQDVCARASLKAVQDYSQAHPDSCVNTVRFVLFTPTAFQSFRSYFKSIILPCIPPPVSKPRTDTDSKPKARPKVRSQSSGQWLWANDDKSFSPYPYDVAAKLTQNYQQNPLGSVQCWINGQSYVICFATMTQTNVSTGFSRNIHFKSSASQGIHWEYANDLGSWSPYQPHESQLIESMYQANSPCVLNILGKVYQLDFANMCQINMETCHQRKIKRVASASVQQSGSSADHDKPLNEELTVLLRGPGDSLPLAKAKFEEKLKTLFKSRTVTFPAALERKLRQIIRKHHVTSSVENVARDSQRKARKPQKSFRIEGLASNVDRAITAIQEEIIQNQVGSEVDGSAEYPPEWEQQTKTTQVFPLLNGTSEWNRVDQLFKTTMPSSAVIQITRIQNKWLWEKYIFQRKRLGVKNGGKINELELFHGTRFNDPKVIYENEDGFDMRYSASGMWGQANYFAVNASYSHGYAHSTPDGYREIFLVKVLTGDSYDSPPNSTLRKPPLKSMGQGASGDVSFAQVQYDTVTGVTGGFRVYMTYDNDKAYPAYLIKYR